MNKGRRRVLSFLLGSALVAAAIPAQDEKPAGQGPDKADYVVHEWGTFTCMVGKAGIALEGLHHEEEALPKFVHDLTKLREMEAMTECKFPASRVTQKMETPVIYFYADQPMRAKVDVWFKQGLMSQFYPLPDTVFPVLADLRKARVDMSKIDMSSLSWDVELIPHGDKVPAEVPAVATDNPWAFARQTGASYVRTLPPPKGERAVEAEHYLFYRGLGRWNPKVELHARPGGKATFKNGMAQRIPFVLCLEIGEQGGRFQRGTALEPSASEELDLGRCPYEPDRERFARRVGADVIHELTAAGLYPDEARAMVATWSRSWFQSSGSRVIYVLPRQQVDEVLPLNLHPQPRELLRVLVGRHEYITPEAGTGVERALRQCRAADPAERQQGEQFLAGLGRFLEPHLRNVAADGADAGAREQAAAMLAAMVK